MFRNRHKSVDYCCGLSNLYLILWNKNKKIWKIRVNNAMWFLRKSNVLNRFVLKNGVLGCVSFQRSEVKAGKTIFVSCLPELNVCKYLLFGKRLLLVNKYVITEPEKTFCGCWFFWGWTVESVRESRHRFRTVSCMAWKKEFFVLYTVNRLILIF